MEDLMRHCDDLHWKQTPMETNEGVVTEKQYRYEPHSRATKPLQLIDERFLPDMHLSWGSAQCAHSQQEILQNCILGVLLNKLGCNYYDPVHR